MVIFGDVYIDNDDGLKGLLYEIIKSKYFQIEMLCDVLKECYLCDFDKERLKENVKNL